MAPAHRLLKTPAWAPGLALAGLLVAARPARAQTSDRPAAATADEARAAFEAGVTFARDERWAEALAAFRRSRAARDRPRTAFNTAIALRQLGRLREARQVLRECVAMPEIAAEPDLGRDAALLLGVVVDAIATLSLTTEPAQAEVRVDGEPTPDPHTIELDPGRHTIAVTAPGHVPQELALAVEPGTRLARAVRLADLPARIEVNATPGDARVYIDGVAAGWGRVRWEGPAGTVRLRATRADHQERTRDVVVRPGEGVAVDLTLVPVRRGLTSSPWFWGGVAGAVVVGAVVATVAALAGGAGEPLSGGSTGVILRAF